jgi:hypothetical protein
MSAYSIEVPQEGHNLHCRLVREVSQYRQGWATLSGGCCSVCGSGCSASCSTAGAPLLQEPPSSSFANKSEDTERDLDDDEDSDEYSSE